MQRWIFLICIKLRKLDIVSPTTRILRYESFIQKIWTNTYKRIVGVQSSLHIPHGLWTSMLLLLLIWRIFHYISQVVNEHCEHLLPFIWIMLNTQNFIRNINMSKWLNYYFKMLTLNFNIFTHHWAHMCRTCRTLNAFIE